MLSGEKVKLLDWQKRIVSEVYGSRDKDGFRVVREVLLTIGRKNGKTALVAMLVLAHLCGPEAERNGELYSVALNREQASLVFKAAAQMVYASPFLSKRLHITESGKRISDSVTGSVYVALSSENKSQLGKSSSFIAFDELAQFGTDDRLYQAMRTSRGARRDPIMWYISTQAADDAALFSALVDHGEKVNSGEIKDKTFKAFIYSVPRDVDVWDEKNWHLANPAIGVFNNIELMREEARKAKEMTGFESHFRNLYMNQRVSAVAGFISQQIWKENNGPPDESVFDNGAEVFGGLDLSEKNDLSALVMVAFGPDGFWHVLPYFWTPGEGIADKSIRDRTPYDRWARDGWLTATPGRTVDYEYIARHIADLHSRWNISAIRFDRYHIEVLKNQLEQVGVPAWVEGADDPISGGLRLISHGQGFVSFSPAVMRLEDLLLNKKLKHGDHPVLRSHAANATVIKNPVGERKLDKKKSTGRIDGMVSLAMALNHTFDKETEDFDNYVMNVGPLVLDWN